MKAYTEKMFDVNRHAFRLVMIVAFFYVALYIFYDGTRSAHYTNVVVIRCVECVAIAIGFIITYSKRLTSTGLNWAALGFINAIIFLTFLLGHYGGLPPFQLSNTLFICFFVSNTLMSYSLSVKFMQTLLMIITYVLYTFWLSPTKDFHTSQILIIITMASFSYAIAIVFERYKLLNFSNLYALETSKAKVEELSELKTRFLAILSHDLVSPLHTLKGILDLVQKGALSSEESGFYLRKVEASLSSSIELAKNIVGWSRAKLEVHSSKKLFLDVDRVIEEVIDSVRDVAQIKNIKVEFTPDATSNVKNDADLVKLAVRNIVSNAIKFSHPNSVISVAARGNEKTVEISITDSGVGMTQDDVSKLFTLKKSSSKGTENESGSGIGLYIVKEFINSAGGSISVTSEIDKGSTFTISLPIVRNVAQS